MSKTPDTLSPTEAADSSRVSLSRSRWESANAATSAGGFDQSIDARHTDDLIATLDLDTAYELPKAPWFEPGASWSVRRTVLHILAETSQHAGHADIIRESLDGQKTMG